MAGFKARARALDMLGRQQIAGIPTAISELFKNAYDAYADNVIVDYFRNDGLFILRDDGYGMTLEDFENRWLTIGTESKLGGLFSTSYRPKDKNERVLMGEKGIGRLAIAMLGSQVLVVTRAVRDEVIHKFVVSFINWKLFECPRLNLEDIYIPIKEFKDFPTNDEINQLVTESVENLKTLENKINKDFYQLMIKELNKFLDASVITNEQYLKEPCKFDNSSSGTRFYIYPSNEYIIHDLEDDKNNNETATLKKMLIGFTDNTIPGHKEIPLKTYFLDYKYPEYAENIVDDTNFFSEDDFYKGDHIFEGKFDEFGQFIGKAKIFGKEINDNYIIPFKNHGKKVASGPFEIKLMALQGNKNESNLNSEEHTFLDNKLRDFGGLYIYKDGIKILPYGDNRYDFLDIEKRRTMHAGVNYWSYRRMYGAIRLTSQNNSSLKEKAGREGFQENSAYADFKEVLINFLKATAKDYFNDGVYSDYFQKQKEENKARDILLKKQEKKKKVIKDNFQRKLLEINKKIEEKHFSVQIDEIMNKLERDLIEVEYIKDKEVAALKLVSIEKESLNTFNSLKRELEVTKPKGVAFSSTIEKSYLYYQQNATEINDKLFSNTYVKIQSLISEKSQNIEVELNRRYRIEQSLDITSKDAKKTISTTVKETSSLLEGVQEKVTKTTKESLKNIEETIRSLSLEVTNTDFQDMTEEDIVKWRLDVENKITSKMNSEKNELDTIKILLDNVQWEKDDTGEIASYVDVMEANDSKVMELLEKSNLDSDLAQLGMAIHVINHEFDASIKVVRDNLRRLKGWADVNTGLTGIYKGIKDSFEHLDSYLTLFTPLNRRLQRNQTEVRGSEIEEFLDKLFDERFKRHQIQLKATKEFRKTVLTSYPSTLYPVFVNIIDNATYWVKNRNEEGIIELDADKEGYIISNNGPEILENDIETIFEMGFSRKPAGRGLGLHIAKEVLIEQGMDIKVIEPLEGYNVSFKIVFNKE